MDRKRLTLKNLMYILNKMGIEDAYFCVKHGESYTPMYTDQAVFNTKKTTEVGKLDKVNTEYEIVLDMESEIYIKQMWKEEEDYDDFGGYQEDDPEFLRAFEKEQDNGDKFIIKPEDC